MLRRTTVLRIGATESVPEGWTGKSPKSCPTPRSARLASGVGCPVDGTRKKFPNHRQFPQTPLPFRDMFLQNPKKTESYRVPQTRRDPQGHVRVSLGSPRSRAGWRPAGVTAPARFGRVVTPLFSTTYSIYFRRVMARFWGCTRTTRGYLPLAPKPLILNVERQAGTCRM